MFDPLPSKGLPPRIQLLAWRLHRYSFNIQRISGKANTADSLSRLPSKCDNSSDSGTVCENYVRFVYSRNMLDLQAITLLDLRRETAKADTLSKLIAQIQSVKWSHNGILKPLKTVKDELSVYEGVILRGNRIEVPFLFQKKVLELSHETHQGIVKTKQFLKLWFFWPSMYRDYHQKLLCVCIESTTEQVQTASTFIVTPWSLDKRCSRHSRFNWREIFNFFLKKYEVLGGRTHKRRTHRY